MTYKKADWDTRPEFRGIRKGCLTKSSPFILGSRMNYHADGKGGRMYLCGCAPGLRIGLKETFPKGGFKKAARRTKGRKFFSSKRTNIRWFLDRTTSLET